MGFDKKAWDPTPAQFAAFATAAGWIFAWLAEFFILRETDVSGTLGKFVSAMMGDLPASRIITPLLAGFAAPFIILWGVMLFDRKSMNFKRAVLTLGAAILAGLLAFGEHDFDLF